jgi:hypothetical protein
LPTWKKLIVSGSDAHFSSVTASNGAIISGSLVVSGSSTFSSIDTLILTGSARITGSSTLIGNQTITGSLLITGSLQATSFTGSLQGTASNAISASFATTASFASTAAYLTPLKSGVVAAGAFNLVGGVYVSNVAFGTTYGNANYSVSITGEDARAFTVANKLQGGFQINTNSNIALAGNVYWMTIPYNNP